MKTKAQGIRANNHGKPHETRVDLLNEVREAVGVKNTWTFDERIYGMYKGKKHNIKSKEDLEKIL